MLGSPGVWIVGLLDC